MNLVRMILKEAGGRMQNAAGAINSDDNMFAGSSGNAPSDKMLGQKENQNPIMEQEETQTETPEVDTSTVSETDTEEAGELMSDEKLKGKLKDLKLSITPKMKMGGMGGGIGNIAGMFGGGEGAEDMGEMAEGAGDAMSDERIKNYVDPGDTGGYEKDKIRNKVENKSAIQKGRVYNRDSAKNYTRIHHGKNGHGETFTVKDIPSDERIKNIFGDNEDAIKAFAKIDAIEFVYNNKAKEIPDGEAKGIDEDPHYGIKAQDLAENPFTASTVKQDESGYLKVDTKELTMANSAVISEICKRLEIIKKILNIKVV